MTEQEAKKLSELVSGAMIHSDISGYYVVDTPLSIPEISDVLNQQGIDAQYKFKGHYEKQN